MSISTNVLSTINRMNNDTNRINFERGQENLGKTSLTKDAFMQLLLAKLQNQDPLNPTDNNEFLTQQAQLAQVEGMDNLSKSFKTTSMLTQASSMVGKNVDIEDTDGLVHTGRISSASIGTNGEVGIMVNGTNYTMNQVRKIYGDAE